MKGLSPDPPTVLDPIRTKGRLEHQCLSLPGQLMLLLDSLGFLLLGAVWQGSHLQPKHLSSAPGPHFYPLCPSTSAACQKQSSASEVFPLTGSCLFPWPPPHPPQPIRTIWRLHTTAPLQNPEHRHSHCLLRFSGVSGVNSSHLKQLGGHQQEGPYIVSSTLGKRVPALVSLWLGLCTLPSLTLD